MAQISVMVNGAPGNVATEIIRHVVGHPGFFLVPYSLTGPEIEAETWSDGEVIIQLLHPDVRDQAIKKVVEECGDFISIDFTHPTAINGNAEFYAANQLPFVMGTTGGDRDALMKTVEASEISAVIAPNMAKQIVGLQAMVEYAADSFPGLFEGYSLSVKESHQKGKADTSGTAKAIVSYFNQLGCDFDTSEIQMEREPQVQKDEWGIPEAYLKGHAWHTYTLISDDETVRFEFTHNVNGREIYAKGTLDAVSYLSEKLSAGSKGAVFSMIDVLKGN